MTQSSVAIVPSPSTSERRNLLRDALPLSLIRSYAHVDLLGADNDLIKRTSGSPSSTSSSQSFWLLRSSSNLVQPRHRLDPSERNARQVLDVISLLVEYGGLLEVMRCLFPLRYGLLSSVPTSCSTRSRTAMGAVPMMSAWRLRQSRLRS